MPDAALLARLRERLPQFIDHTRTLVEVESPSSDPAACTRAAEVAAELCADLLPEPARLESHHGCTVLRWGPDAPRVLLLGHLDTVWPHGTLAEIPFSATPEERGLVLRGPGIFDMKAGAVQAMHALAEITAALPGADVGLLLTTDEEIGSAASVDVILAAVARAEAALVLEPSVDAALKSARKGTSWYDITVHGRASHAGLDPESGINAMLSMARLALAAAAVGDPDIGSSTTPTLASAGTTGNTVPDRAQFMIDVRAWTPHEQQRIDDAMRALAVDESLLRGARADVGGGVNRPAMAEASARPLLDRAERLCAAMGLPFPGARAVGGASDGNYTAGAGVATLDGLGAVGAGAHARDEWVLADAMPERSALVAALVLDVLA